MTTLAHQIQTQLAGSTVRAFDGPNVVEYLWWLRVIVSDDIPTTGSGASTEYSTFFFTQGAVVTGEQAPIRTQTDRDILALEEAMAVDLHYIYHPVGLKYAVSTVNPNRTVLKLLAHGRKCMRQRISVLLELLTYLIRINHAFII